MNQYRCETCKYNDNGYCEVFDYRLYSSEIDTLAVFGCASHSDFQSGCDNVLDKIIKHCRERAGECPDEETYTDSEMEILVEWIEKEKDGEPSMTNKTHSFCYKKYCETRCICNPIYPPRCGFGCGMCNCSYCLDTQTGGVK